MSNRLKSKEEKRRGDTMNEITTKTAYVWPISISGHETQKEEMRETISTLGSLVEKYGGRTLPVAEFKDGFFLEAIFEDPEILNQCKNEAGIR